MADSTRKTANLWGYTIEQGGWDAARGTIPEKVPSYRDVYALRCRVGSNVDIPSRTLSLSCSDNVKINYVWIDENGYSLGGSGYQTNGDTATAPNDAVYMTFILAKLDESECTPSDFTNIMLVAGSTPLPYEPYGWVHSLRKLGTATETIQSGDTIYTNGQPITAYTIKGNEEHTGTPSPQNPVMPQGTGNKTANLLDYTYIISTNFVTVTQIPNGVNLSGNFYAKININLEIGNTYYMSWNLETISGSPYVAWRVHYTDNTYSSYIFSGSGYTIEKEILEVLFYVTGSSSTASANITNIMFNAGSTALPYEPYGYKIPISSANTTTPVYLGEVETTRKIYKSVLTGQESWAEYGTGTGHFYYIALSPFAMINIYPVCSHYTTVRVASEGKQLRIYENYESTTDFTTYLQQQYAAGTPVTIWYVLATPTTGIVNEPLMKIGTYADSISNATPIPTTDGTNTITVDTTVQPSEFTATWTGWHNSSVKEYDGSDWQ